MLSRRSHERVGTAPAVSMRTWSSRAQRWRVRRTKSLQRAQEGDSGSRTTGTRRRMFWTPPAWQWSCITRGSAGSCQKTAAEPEDVVPTPGEDEMPRNCSASAIWRAKASAASRSRSQARAASRTRSRPSAAAARAVTRAARMVESGRWVTGGGGGAGKGAVPPAPAAALGPAASPLDRAPRPCAAPHVRISDFLDQANPRRVAIQYSIHGPHRPSHMGQYSLLYSNSNEPKDNSSIYLHESWM